MSKQRVWELDAFRGLCLAGMVGVHLIFDLALFGMIPPIHSPLLDLLSQWGGGLFVVLSGICVTLGRRHIQRGFFTFSAGMLCTLVTWLLYRLGITDRELIIYFGVLHCLGVCMVLWSLLGRLPVWLVTALGVLLTAVGLRLELSPVLSHITWLIPLGIVYPGFASGDYFPLLPFLGFFLLGAVIGMTVYRRQQTRFPRVNAQSLPIRTLCAMGRHSLAIYLLHQPLLFAAVSSAAWLLGLT